MTVGGKSRPQISWLIYHDTKEQNLTEGLRPLFPGAKWIEYKPAFAQTPEPTLVEVWGLRVLEYLDRLPLGVKRISSRKLKAEVGAGEIATKTWQRIIRQVCEQSSNVTMTHRNHSSMVGSEVSNMVITHRNLSSMIDGQVLNTSVTSTPWKRDGQSLVRVEASLFGFEAA
jgi:hypothetical protein